METRNKRKVKRKRRNALHMSLTIPKLGLSEKSKEQLAELLLEKTRQKSRLLYNLNKTDLADFVSDGSNNFLVAYFDHHQTMDSSAALCKVEALQTLIHFCS
jgi:hypothetical protein